MAEKVHNLNRFTKTKNCGNGTEPVEVASIRNQTIYSALELEPELLKKFTSESDRLSASRRVGFCRQYVYMWHTKYSQILTHLSPYTNEV